MSKRQRAEEGPERFIRVYADFGYPEKSEHVFAMPFGVMEVTKLSKVVRYWKREHPDVFPGDTPNDPKNTPKMKVRFQRTQKIIPNWKTTVAKLMVEDKEEEPHDEEELRLEFCDFLL